MNDNNTLPTYTHQGYISRLWYNDKDRNRIYGSISRAESPDIVAVDTCFAGDTLEEVKERFISCVNRHIWIENYKAKQADWKSRTNFESIAVVYNILPKEFRRLIEEHKFDESFIGIVKGGAYEVPLYYVTKAWDFILNGSLCGYDFMIGPWHNADIEEWKDFISGETPNRFRCQAIANNNEIKSIWLKYFGINVDELDIDFSIYDKHLEPNVSFDDERYFFQDVPGGVEEYILGPVNRPPSEYIYFDTVSDLMEYCAYLNKYRPEYGDCDD